jgi:DNA-directed RNA polymerase specialized sigma24 family protein
MPISSYSDEELLKAIRQDDEKAFEELFERYWRQVHAMAYARVLSKGVTQEIVQDVFISLWDQRATLSISYVPEYLNALTKNCVVDYMGPHPLQKKHWKYNEVISECPPVTDHDFKVRSPQLDQLSIAQFARSFISLKRLFNSLSHNQQKG